METGPKLGSRNLGDFLQIKQDDNNHNNVGSITGPNSSHSGVTLNSILSDKSGQIQPGHEQPPRVHSNRTLADIIRDESSAAAAAKVDGKRTWQLLKFKLRHHVSSGGSSLTPPNNDRMATTSGPGPTESTQPETRPSNSVSAIDEHTSSLAMRLQSESNDDDDEVEVEGNIPARTSLMALLAETDRQMGLDGSAFLMDNMDGQDHKESGGLVVGYNSCCVCMVRHKGAAFIPCGHTFCRLCSRELWVQRGSCPLCNNCIVEILDIF